MPTFDTFFMGYGYEVLGVPVADNAIGAPTDRSLSDTFGVIDLSDENPSLSLSQYVQSASACFPYLARNPVSCHPGGTVTVSNQSVMLEHEGCKVSTPVYAVDPAVDAAGAMGACTDGMPVGQAKFLVGGVHGYAEFFNSYMLDPTGSNTSYSVACSVDMTNAVEYQLLSLSRLAGVNSADDDSDNNISELLSYGVTMMVQCTQSCTPVQTNGQVLPLTAVTGNDVLALGAGAHSIFTWEGAYRDGISPTFFETIQLQYATDLGLDFGAYLPQSRNAIEDILGVLSGATLGYNWAAPDGYMNTAASSITGTILVRVFA